MIELIITVIYYTMMVLNQIWVSPLGDAFREWFKQTKNKKPVAEIAQ